MALVLVGGVEDSGRLCAAACDVRAVVLNARVKARKRGSVPGEEAVSGLVRRVSVRAREVRVLLTMRFSGSRQMRRRWHRAWRVGALPDIFRGLVLSRRWTVVSTGTFGVSLPRYPGRCDPFDLVEVIRGLVRVGHAEGLISRLM